MRAAKTNPGTRRRQHPEAKASHHEESAGAKILAAIEEATEVLRSEGLDSPHLTVRSYRVLPAPTALATSNGSARCSGRIRRCWRGSWE